MSVLRSEVVCFLLCCLVSVEWSRESALLGLHRSNMGPALWQQREDMGCAWEGIRYPHLLDHLPSVPLAFGLWWGSRICISSKKQY